jgi:cytochrome P450
VVYRIIERARHHQPDGHTLLTALLDAQASPAGQLTDRQLRDELVSLIVAGYETTAVTLTWAFALLGQYPDVESRLVAELDRHLDHDAVSVDAVPRLEYVDWVIAESLRLYPTSWVIARETQTACSVGQFRITPGTVVLMSQWTVHRDSRFFDDPDVFRPERWANHLMDRLPRFAYFPFGGGPRVCVGNDFARLEMVLLLATIARQFRLEFRPDAPLIPRPSATLRPDPHPRVVVRPRGTAGRVTRHHSRYHEALDGHPQTGAGGRAAPWAVCQR